MVAITIRNVPLNVKEELAARASRSGKSLQAYLLEMFVRSTEKRPLEEVLAEVRFRVAQEGTRIGAEEIVRSIREDRDDPRR